MFYTSNTVNVESFFLYYKRFKIHIESPQCCILLTFLFLCLFQYCYTAVACTGVVWSRYSTVITPVSTTVDIIFLPLADHKIDDNSSDPESVKRLLLFEIYLTPTFIE